MVMAVKPVLSHNTVTSLAHVISFHRRLDFFYSNTNNFVQLEDTTIKTERCCLMQRTERTTAVHHSSLGLHCRSCPDLISCAAGLISRIQCGNGG